MYCIKNGILHLHVPLLQPDIRLNFLRNCIRVGLRGGDTVLLAALVVVLGKLDSIEYCLDSTEACRGEERVLQEVKRLNINFLFRLTKGHFSKYSVDGEDVSMTSIIRNGFGTCVGNPLVRIL